MMVATSLRRTLPAVPWTVTALRTQVAAFATQAGIGEPLLTGVKLAVSEAVTNVVLHAYVHADEAGDVHLVASVDGDCLRVVVSDDGCGMVPRPDSPGLGAGLPFIAYATDTVDIECSASGGTRVYMAFRIAGAVDTT